MTYIDNERVCPDCGRWKPDTEFIDNGACCACVTKKRSKSERELNALVNKGYITTSEYSTTKEYRNSREFAADQRSSEYRKMVLQLYGLSPEEIAMINAGYALYHRARHTSFLDCPIGDEYRWSKEPINGCYVVRGSVLRSETYVPSFGRNYRRRRVEMGCDGLERRC